MMLGLQLGEGPPVYCVQAVRAVAHSEGCGRGVKRLLGSVRAVGTQVKTGRGVRRLLRSVRAVAHR